MAFVWFILAAAVTVYTAIKLSTYADVISTKTAMGGLFVGTLLLAGATSLPEVTTSFSAVLIGNNNIAIGNLLGSSLFNVFIHACFDLYYRKKQLFLQASHDHVYMAGIGIMMTLLVMASLTLRIDYTIFGLGIDSLLIAGIYLAKILILNRLSKKKKTVTQPEPVHLTSNDSSKITMTVKHATIGFIIAAIVIMGAGTMLSIMGDRIAVITGLGSSFIGSFLVAAATSFPEAVAVFVALRLRNINLAMGSILGSNIFNIFIISGSDLIYRDGAIISSVSSSHLTTAIGIFTLSVITTWAVLRKRVTSSFMYMVPSLLVVVIYFVTSYLIFMNS
ncbi:sodium:calcium antiporter [Jeotgalibacillus salarius]|uniref:Sodium:calcium antiporter n=1 Tax=Jeotgalibacillus salarius TaxID=546023 RepID=A0A4Y8LSW1_9BACL|nr:sodium:calcium antiporter [Jeotgalibacillus salarius]TFE04055.1 sodium:calcium antiporter [Jeotgalibacillus salarius]